MIYKNIEIPLVSVLKKLERNGICIDEKNIQQQQKEVIKNMQSFTKKTYDTVGEEFNLDSPNQVQNILFSADKQNIPVVKKNANG